MRNRITTQSVLSLIISLVIIVSIALIFIQIQYSVNQKVISSLADDKINIISRVLQVAIDDIEELTLEIISYNDVQNYPIGNKDTKESQLQIRNIAGLFSSYQIFRPYIETVYIKFVNNETLSIGNIQEVFTEEYLESRETILKDKKGKFIISSYPGNPDHFIASRQIRRIKNLEQDHIASLYMVISFDKLLDIYFRQYGIKSIKSFLQQGNNEFYSYDNQLDFHIMLDTSQKNKGVYRIDSSYFYINSVEIKNADWRFFILLPFSKIIILRNILMYGSIIGLLLGFLGLVLWGRNWSRKVTKPIMVLANSMEEIQNIDFADRSYSLPKYTRDGDEIAVLYNNFTKLLKKIDTLIHENYLKQILLKETQIQNLLAQINPHFIYNTLDTISWMAQTGDTDNISDMVQSLALLLRASISSENFISLSKEIELLSGYLNIQKIRFQERLQFEIIWKSESGKITVPSMILQPIVENSIKYNLDIPKTVVMVKIELMESDTHLIISISDNGPGISQSRINDIDTNKTNDSIGLVNIKNRLNIFYGDLGKLEIISTLGEGTDIRIFIPLNQGGIVGKK